MLYDFTTVYLPYIIQQQEDDSYVILNRERMPLGFTTRKIENYPDGVKFKGLTPLRAEKISFNGDQNTSRIVLYDDECMPTASEKNMNNYLNRLKILAKLKTPEPPLEYLK